MKFRKAIDGHYFGIPKLVFDGGESDMETAAKMIEAMVWQHETGADVWPCEIVRARKWGCALGRAVPVYRDTPWNAILAAKKASEE